MSGAAGASGRAPRPFWLTTPVGPVFAWHHRPEGAVREAAVVLCRPFGYDAQCTQRAYRHLAERLGAAGFHVLRLDYHGTGDSSGSDADDDRLAAWVASVRAAMDWARATLDVSKIALFGTRFGALVASEASAQGGVDALVVLAPPASGRAWLRETRALQAMMGRSAGVPRGRSQPPGPEESAGFLLTEATTAAVGELEMVAADARAVLVVRRDDLPGGEDVLATWLRGRGVDVTLSAAPGYGAMVQQDPQRSIVPDAAWAEIAEWLCARYGVVSDAPVDRATYPRVACVRESAAAPVVREEAVDIEGLFGIVTEPLPPSGDPLPAIVLPNIGVNSHVGANRMYVGMARRWAALGFRVLRFDSAGLGDSPADERAAENQAYSAGITDDSTRAMDFLERTRGAQRFVLIGLCSGAYVSFHAAAVDERVAGIALLNIQLFHWKEGDPVDVRKRDVVKSTHFYWKAAFAKDVWVRLARGEVNVGAIAQGVLGKAWEIARHRVVRAIAGESDVVRTFRSLLRRGTDVLLVFSADDGGRDTVDGHLGVNAKCFRHERHFRIEIIEGSDHTFSSSASREALITLLTDHMMRRFSKGATESSS